MIEENKINPQSIITPEAVLNTRKLSLTRDIKTDPKKGESFYGNKIDLSTLDSETLEKVARSIEGFLKELQIDLKIQIHKGTGRTMFKIISKDDGKVVREVPPEEFLNIAAKMHEMVGLLFNRDA